MLRARLPSGYEYEYGQTMDKNSNGWRGTFTIYDPGGKVVSGGITTNAYAGPYDAQDAALHEGEIRANDYANAPEGEHDQMRQEDDCHSYEHGFCDPTVL